MKKAVLLPLLVIILFIAGCTENTQTQNNTNQNSKSDEISCAIAQDGTDPCPSGSICHWSCAGNCTEPEGDFLCHNFCRDDGDCLGTTMPYCRVTYISRGDIVQPFSFCVR